MSVSILTPSQYSRIDNILCLWKLIINQKYENIIEWTIVNGSKNIIEANKFKKFINKFKQYSHIKINFIDWVQDRTFADLFNVGNNMCIGDYIAIMEDDEYYFPTYISHAVESLNYSNCEIAGCSGIYIWNNIDKKMYKCIHLHDNHSCNHALVYTKKYSETNSFLHNPEKPYSIESSFLNNYTSKMVQMEPNKTLVHILHNHNTIDWSKFINNSWKNILIEIENPFSCFTPLKISNANFV